MNKTVFAGTAKVAIQGKRTLRFMNLTNQSAKYKLLGFRKPSITVVDYRKKGLQAIAAILAGGSIASFPRAMNQPSHVTIRKLSSSFRVELRDPLSTAAESTLWVAIGIDARLPVYDYVLREVSYLGDDKFALFSVFRKPTSLAA